MKLSIFFLLFLMCSCLATAQSPDWQVTANEEIISYQLSTSGTYLVYVADKEQDNMQCINTKTGAVLWTKTIEDFNEYFVGRFVDNDVYMIAHKKVYEFVKLADGSVVKSLDIAGESWDDAIRTQVYFSFGPIPSGPDPDYTAAVPYFFGDVGLFYFSTGFQMVDLKKQKIVHQSPCEVNMVRYERWNDKLMIVLDGDCDSLYVVDTTSGHIDYKLQQSKDDLNSRVMQHFAATDKQMFLFNEDNILCIDLNTNEIPAIIGIDPEDPDVYLPVSSKDELYLVISQDDQQSLYRCRDGERVWETEAGTVPGVVDMARLYNNDKDLVLFTYQEDGKMGVHKVDMKTGKQQWSRLLFEQEDIYEPGHLKGGKTGAFIVAAVLSTVSNMTGGARDASGRTTFYRPNWTAIERGLARSKSSEGYAYLLDTTNQSRLVIAMGGRIYTELKKTERDDYDGEGFVVLDLKDGKVIEHTPAPIIAESEKSGSYNAVRFMTVASFKKADIVMGTHDVYVASKEKVERIPFHAEDDIVNFISSSDELEVVNFSVERDYEQYDYWVLDVSSLPARRVLCARSNTDNFVFVDTSSFACMVHYNEGELAGYKFESGDMTESRLASPIWKLSEDDIDEMEIGSVEENQSTRDRLQGIRVIDGSIFLLGTSGIGKISPDGKCRWSIEWDVDIKEWKKAPTKVGSYLVYSMGGNTRIIRDNCNDAKLISEHEIDNDDVEVITNESNEIVVLDKSEGIIYGYHAK